MLYGAQLVGFGTVQPVETDLCDSDDLVRLLQAGDIEILDRVTRCFGDRLMAEARRRCRTADEADDALQDAALTAWRYGPGFRGDGPVDRWLVRLVASACNRLRRGMKRDGALHVDDRDLVAEDDSPELLAARARLAEVLSQTLLDLAPQDRAIVLLADGQGWTAPEIAEALSMTPGSIRTRLSRTHARLRQSLADEGLGTAGELSGIDR